MVFKITSWSTDKWYDGRFINDPIVTLFDSNMFIHEARAYLTHLPSTMVDFVQQIDISKYRFTVEKLRISIENNQIKEVFTLINNSLSTVETIIELWNNVKDITQQWVDSMIFVAWVPIKRSYIMLYFLVAINLTTNLRINKWTQWTKQDIAQIITPKKTWVSSPVNQTTLTSSVELPVANKENPSIIYPKAGATLMDITWAVRNILLPGIEKINGTTQCAKTARLTQEKIYGAEWFIIREEYDKDMDAIWYHIRSVSQDASELKEKYPLLKDILIINEIDADKKLVNNVNRYNLEGTTLVGSKELAILTTTQNNESVEDGHAVAVNNMYNIDGTVEWVYVYDPYLSKSIHKRYKGLSDEEKQTILLEKDSGYHIPISTYFAYCKYKGRVPLWISIYEQPSTPTQLVTTKKVSEDINIKQSDLKQFNDLYPKVVAYIEESKDRLGGDFLYSSWEQDLANMAQESRLSPFAVNKRWFQWIGQMNNTALKAVYDKYPFIKEKFDNKTKVKQLNLEEMILASKLYKNGVIYSQICASKKALNGRSIKEVIDQKDSQQFVLAAYNRWSTRLADILSEYARETNNYTNISWGEFSDHFIDKIDKWEITNNWYKELFGSDEENRVWYVTWIEVLQNLVESENLLEFADQSQIKIVEWDLDTK